MPAGRSRPRFRRSASSATPAAPSEPTPSNPAAERGAAAFGLHPLQTITHEDPELIGAWCAVSGSTPEALALAGGLARRLGMQSFEISDQNRAAYHAAASIASNFLVTLEESAVQLIERAGIEDGRAALGPLVLRTATNWRERGAAALTGPIARGDEVDGRAPPLRDRSRMPRGPRPLPGARRADPHAGRRGRRSGRMRIVREKAELRDALSAQRREGRTIGLVPTMGSLHEGHLSLLRAARAECDVVVMSLFVNPSQFGEGEDLDRYPRDEQRDTQLAQEEGVDLVYAPSVEVVYPDGYGTHVEVEALTRVLDGDPRRRGPEHFRGVTTIVAKLFNTVQPDRAYFGQKDAQQAIVIERMVRDLDFAVQVRVLPIVREPSGLAMSSRNAYLDSEQRERAAAISRALRTVQEAAGDGSLSEALERARGELREAGIEPEYLEARDAEDLSPVAELNGRPVLVAVAAQIGGARLIDNVVITVPDPPPPE